MINDSEIKTITVDTLELLCNRGKLPGLSTKLYRQAGIETLEVIAREGAIGDWAAYMDTPVGRAADRNGYKLLYSIAAELFPLWDNRLAWRL